MEHRPAPLEVLVYQDVLCAFSHVADQRLNQLREEFGERFRWSTRPYPLRIPDAVPSESAIAAWVRDYKKAALEPEGQSIRTDLWTGSDPPKSSMPALVALEVARLHGEEQHGRMLRALRQLGLEQGVNVNRSDVLYEVAERLGLPLHGFIAALGSAELRKLILEELRDADSRGVKGAPTVVIADKWMITGLRSVDEYREHLIRCLESSGMSGDAPPDSSVD